jgi:RNA polymerase sigma-54 factor
MRQEMRMKLAPRMIQSMEILQLPIMALQERINQELDENPTLIQPESGIDEPASPEDLAGAKEQTPADETEGPAEPTTSESDAEYDPAEEFVDDVWRDEYEYSGGPRISRGASDDEADRKHDAMQNMVARPQTLQDYLEQQIGFFDCPRDVRAIAEFIINNLDTDGRLGMSLDDVVRLSGSGATLDKAEAALRFVQRLDPPGVGARDLRECLLLQLTRDMPHYEMLRVLIGNHLDDIIQNRLPVIERKTGYAMDDIKAVIKSMATLKTRPGADFVAENNHYVVPDILVEQDEEGNYKVRLEDEHTPHLYISKLYQRLLRDRSADPATREFIQRKIQSARWLIESIEQRRNTIMRVAQAIIDHQREFLDKGADAIHPLKMQEIADRVGVHVTTVSRAVDDKWIQTPRGIFPLKRFFGSGTVTDDGSEVAWEIVRQKLLDIIAGEDKANPLSDDEIVAKFADQGVHIARRTITKYRKILAIPSSRHRKQF